MARQGKDVHVPFSPLTRVELARQSAMSEHRAKFSYFAGRYFGGYMLQDSTDKGWNRTTPQGLIGVLRFAGVVSVRVVVQVVPSL